MVAPASCQNTRHLYIAVGDDGTFTYPTQGFGGRAMHVLCCWLVILLSVCLQGGAGPWGRAAGPGGGAVNALEDGKGFTAADADRLRAYMDKQRRCRDVPSMSVSVVFNGNIAMEEAIGFANLEKKIAATKDTMYCIASLSKAFTSALLAKQIDRKNMTWDARLKDVLPQMDGFKDEYRTNHVTIRDLLLHRTGIPRNDYLWISGGSTPEELYKSIKCMSQVAEFRAAAIYNNILYAVAGDVAQALGGASWEALVRRELLEPLNMTSTTFLQYVEDMALPMATQYSYSRGNQPIADPLRKGAMSIGPAISICSTASDMSKWMGFHLSNGRDQQGRQVVPEEKMKDLHTGQVSAHQIMRPTQVGPDNVVMTTYDMYGLGWFKGYHRGYEALMHYGSYPGFYSMITMLPGKNFGIFSSINGGRNERSYTVNSLIHSYAMDLALDVKPDPNISSSCSFPPPQDEPQNKSSTQVTDCKDAIIAEYSLPTRHLLKYEGNYSHPVFGNLTFWVTGGKLHLKYNNIIFEMYPQSQDIFCIQTLESSWFIGPQQTTFHKHAHDGTLTSVSVPFITNPGEDNWFRRLPPGVSHEQWRDELCGSRSGVTEPCPELVTAASHSRDSTFPLFVSVLFVLFHITTELL